MDPNIKQLEEIQKQFEEFQNEITPDTKLDEKQTSKLDTLVEEFSNILNNLKLDDNEEKI